MKPATNGRDSPRGSSSPALKQQLAQALAELAIAREHAASSDAKLSAVADQNKALTRRAASLKRANNELEGEHELLKRDLYELQMEHHQMEGQAMIHRGAERDHCHEIIHLHDQLQEQASAHDARVAALHAKTTRLIVGVLPLLLAPDLQAPPPAAASATVAAEVARLELLEGRRTASEAAAIPVFVSQTLTLGFDDAAVQEKVLSILGRLCADDLSEDEALQQLSGISHSLHMLAIQPTPAAAPAASPATADEASAATAPPPQPQSKEAAGGGVMETEGGAVSSFLAEFLAPAAESVAAAVSAEQPEQPAVPEVTAAAHPTVPAAGTSGSGRPSLEGPQAAGGSSNHIFLSQFILSDPEKLQRLIARSHYRSPNPSILATAASAPTTAEPGQSPALPADSSHNSSTASGSSRSSSSDSHASSAATTSTAPNASWAGRFLNNFTTWHTVPASTTAATSTPSLTLTPNSSAATALPESAAAAAAPDSSPSDAPPAMKALPRLPARNSPTLKIVGSSSETPASSHVPPVAVVRKTSLSLAKDSMLSAASSMLDAAKGHAPPDQAMTGFVGSGSSSSAFGSDFASSTADGEAPVRASSTELGKLAGRK
ncbi:MAG: hypothetical protein WDW36_004979 [Sanguina aurantia]